MLKLKFYQIENVVLMRILEQPERNFSYVGQNGISLRSIILPDINPSEQIINLRGSNKKADNLLAVADFLTEEAALDFISKAQECVTEYNGENFPQEVKDENLIINEFIAK